MDGGWRAGESAPNILLLLFDIIQNISFGMKHCRLGCSLQLSTIADNQVWHHVPLCCTLKLSTVGGVSLLASCTTVLRSQTFHHVSPMLEGYQFWHLRTTVLGSQTFHRVSHIGGVSVLKSRTTVLTYQTFCAFEIRFRCADLSNISTIVSNVGWHPFWQYT